MLFEKKSTPNVVIAVAVVLIIFICLSFTACFPSKKEFNDTFFCMDTVVAVTMDKDYTKETKKIMTDLNNLLDCHNNESMLSSLNNEKSLKCDKAITDIIKQTSELNNRFGYAVDISAGALTLLWNIGSDNPQIPDDCDIKTALSTIDSTKIKINDDNVNIPKDTLLDFGSVAKGYALDCVKSDFDKNDIGYGIVSTGSSVLLYGKKDNDDNFYVQIRNPIGEGTVGTVKTTSCFLSTSGGYERFFEANGQTYCHIFDLSTGYPSKSDLTSVTVFCDSGIMSDFLSTLIFIGGTEKLSEYINADDYKIVAIDNANHIYTSDGVDFSIDESSGYTMVENNE